MALRIARGLFRLWLVLSVLWIGGVGVVTWRTLPVNEFVIPSAGRVVPAPPDNLASWFGIGRLYTPDGTFDPSTASAFDPSKPYTVLRDKERWEAVRLASVVALLPPAFMLAVGSALVWAFRGFRNFHPRLHAHPASGATTITTCSPDGLERR
jgi:hypothetical protein